MKIRKKMIICFASLSFFSLGIVETINANHDLNNVKGTLINPNGDTYEGDIVDNLRTGKGTLTLANGNKYVCEFVQNKRTGKGTLYSITGDKYIGNFVDGKFNQFDDLKNEFRKGFRDLKK